jgi:hypothetical protein
MNISRPKDAPSVFLLDESAEGASNKVPGLIFKAMATVRLDSTARFKAAQIALFNANLGCQRFLRQLAANRLTRMFSPINRRISISLAKEKHSQSLYT